MDARAGRRWVGIILRRYGALNVRTIDSLLHLIVRLTALELDLPPDFEPVFATDEAIRAASGQPAGTVAA